MVAHNNPYTEIGACEEPPPPECADFQQMEYDAACKTYSQLVKSPSNSEFAALFFSKPFATNPEDVRNWQAHLITKQKVCSPTNHVASCCVEHKTEDCPACKRVWSGCPDPNACPSESYGIDYHTLATEYLRTSRMPSFNFAQLEEMVDGDWLVWDELAMPENDSCDPCMSLTMGAFVPFSVKYNTDPNELMEKLIALVEEN